MNVSDNRNPVPRMRRRISTLLFFTLSVIASLVLLGLVVMSVRLFEIQAELGKLRDSALPRLVKIAQLSQDASATSSIAPALSAKPTRSEFETLLSRIKDKEASQTTLIDELTGLVRDDQAAQVLRSNQAQLIDNLRQLTEAVREQIGLDTKLENRTGFFRETLQKLSDGAERKSGIESAEDANMPVSLAMVSEQVSMAAFEVLNALLDPNRARQARNRDRIEKHMRSVSQSVEAVSQLRARQVTGPLAVARELAEYWSQYREEVYTEKQTSLANSFKIKALVEENSLIANRLLSSANNEFWKANSDLEMQIRLANETTRFTIISIFAVVAAFAAGNFVVWYILRVRVFRRLDRMRDALRIFAGSRTHGPADSVRDEIGEISQSLSSYMAVIDEQESELARKTGALEQLSNQLAKYLSPQVYDSIFTGRQEVKVASTRKKLTIFFSDIAGFTATADRLESEELTQLLNQYLTEMSRIALNHGATIDKYVGDAILIFFGDPDTRGVREDALFCVKMAIAMRERMHELQAEWLASGIEHPLSVRMGINTGFCTVGNFGSEDRMDYTIIGGAVNTASRLESAAVPGEILISYETFALVKDKIHCEEHGQIEVKGIAYPIATYSVIGINDGVENSGWQLREDKSKLKVEMDTSGMSDKERAQAKTILRRTLARLSDITKVEKTPKKP